QAIRTQDETVARFEQLLVEIDLDRFALAERSGDDVSPRVVASLLGTHQAARNLLGDPGVVASELPQAAVSDQIGAAIADVRQDGAFAQDQGGHNGRHDQARFSPPDIGLVAFPYGAIARLDRLLKAGE